MQTAVRKRAADFDFLGDTPTPEFCENSRERGPRSPAGTAQGFDPPLGPHRNAAGAARQLCRSQAGGGALAAVCLGGRGAGFCRGGAGKAQCRAARRALPGRGEPEPSFRAAAGSQARAVCGAFRGGRGEGAAGGGRGAARPGRLPVAGMRRAAARAKRLHPARLV